MKCIRQDALVLGIFAFCTLASTASGTPPTRIAFYATLQGGLAEARRSDRPILFVSAAPHCHGVSGIW